MKTFVLKVDLKEEEDGRRVVIHYHHSKDTLPPGTLKSFIDGIKWTGNDLKRLRII